MRENDIVVAKKDLSNKVHKGYIGTIVMIYTEPREAYEVEFFDINGDTVEVRTVEKEEINGET